MTPAVELLSCLCLLLTLKSRLRGVGVPFLTRPRFCLQLDVADLKQQLARSQTLFPDNPSVWVKDLAGYLNQHLAAPDSEPTLSSFPYGESRRRVRIRLEI